MIRLAYGVAVGRGLGVWAPGPDGAALDAAHASPPAGAPVVVGPRRSDAADVAAALEGLTELVDRGGDIVAGAGVDLGGGFRTGRLEGGAGDRRDAILAALRVLGTGGAARLGERAGLLVALFGPAATKRVGAAATAVLHDGRWTALHLASAASDVLGPEQLERVLALREPEPEDRPAESYGLASALAVDLARVLTPYPRPRRLTLLLDLWGVVAAQRADAARRRRLRALRGPDERLAEVRTRYRRHMDDEVAAAFGGDRETVSLIRIARWVPGTDQWREWLLRVMADAVAATMLLRAAIAVAEDGLADGLARVRPLLDRRLALTRRQQGRASEPRRGLAPVAARPGVYVRELDQRLAPQAPLTESTAAYVHARLGLARDYGVVVLEAVQELLDACAANDVDLTGEWRTRSLREVRAVAGYTARRPPHAWHQPVLAGDPYAGDYLARSVPLAQRLADRPDQDPSDVETPADLLWFAELADAVAQIDGHDAATVEYGEFRPFLPANPRPPEADPMRPADDSIPRALAGAAQLVELGAVAPAKPRTWPELVDGLMASAVVAESLTGGFPVPRVLLDRDGVALPPTPGDDAAREVRVEIARAPHQLVEWANYMGNCISGPFYLGAALRGRSVLLALRDPAGTVVANVELCPHRTGWRVDQFQARFNSDPPAELEERLRAWVASLPKPARKTAVAVPRREHAAPHRPYRPNRDLADLRHALIPLAARALADADVRRAADVLAHAAGAGDSAGLAALRRVRRDELDQAVRRGLAEGVDLADLWRATAVRPLVTALDGLDAPLRERIGQALLGDGPLPALSRRLARTGPINEARTVELVARRLRRSLGRLARADDPVLAPLVPRQADAALLCVLVLAVSTAATAPRERLTEVTRRGEVSVPGFPASTVDDPDGPWQRGRADATELGADLTRRVPPALLVPTSWLGRGGWPALWARVNRVAKRQ